MIRLKNHKYAQCGVEFGAGGDIHFISYTTTVIKAINKGNGIYDITCSGTYSQTTRKQIGWFLAEYFPTLNYYDMKAIAGTGDIITVDRYRRS